MKKLKLFYFVICSFTIFSCSSPNGEVEIIKEVELIDLQRAQINYRNHCGGCHGQNFESFIERDWTYGNTFEAITNSIKIGYDGNGMPGYESLFSQEEIEDLSLYILQEIEGKTKDDIQQNNPNLSGIITSDDIDFRLEIITDQIEGIPWGMIQLPDGDFLVTQRQGKLFRVSSQGVITEITGVPAVSAAGQGGLLDVVLHPNFENNNFVYLSHSVTDPNNSNLKTTAVTRVRLSGNTLTNSEQIFVALPYVSGNAHFGSRLIFDNLGYLYISVGDRRNRDVYPQELDNGIGKIHRINDDGTIPINNPFYNQSNATQSIFNYGVRNPQGLTIHPVTGDIWEGEHGPQGGDEINILNSGKNYGWPVITYGINYNGTIITDLTEMEGMEQPIYYWTPSIAPAGMDFVASNFYKVWENDLFVGSLKFEYLHRVKMDGNQVIGQEELLNDIGRIRDVQMGNDGYLYILVQNPGRLIRIVPEQ